MNDKPYLGALLLITLFACQPEPLERSEPTDSSPPHPTVVAQPTPPTTDPVSQAVPDGARCGDTVTTAQGTV